MENNISYEDDKKQSSYCFKSTKFKLDEIDDNDDSDKSIIDFDDEYSEVSNLYSLKSQKNRMIGKYDDAHSDSRIHSHSIGKQIIYQNLKQLMDIDINNKKGIIDLLMRDDLIQKKSIETKEKNNNKFYYVKAKTKNQKTGNEKGTYGRTGFQIEAREGDPEFIKDINIAAGLLKNRIQEKDENVAKILFDELYTEPNSKKIITRKEIGDKVNKTLEKRRKNLEKIEAKIYGEQKIEETFTPSINNRSKFGMRRNLKLFLQDQSDFQQRVQKKRQEILFRSESEKKVLNLGHPFIDKNSKILAQKLNNNENVYIRLYKSSKEKNKENKEQKIIQENDKKINQKKPKKNAYSHIKSKINIMRKNQSQINNNKNIKNMAEKNNKKRSKSPFLISVKKNLLNIKDLPTNKMLWDKFNKNFDNALNLLNLNYSEELELDEYQYYQLLYNLGMVTYNFDKNEKEENKNDIERNNSEELTPEILIENSLKIDEKKLVKNSFNILKIEENKNKIKLIDIKNFLIFVLDNQLYEFYYQFKKRHSPKEIKNLFPSNKFKKDCIPNEIIKRYNEELISEVDKTNPKNTKYYYVSKDNKIIFTLDKLQLIKKDFNILSINYRNHKEKSTDEKLDNFYKYPFKPKINEKSEKIYHQYKDKILLSQNENKINLKHIDRLLLLDKKRKAENQKIKEELDKIRIQECTFKPKINLSYPKAKINKNNKKINKFEELYEKGKIILQSKKDRTKEEIELEKQKNELTFQPSLTKESIPITNFTNDIYNEKEYKFLYDRLMHGRLERMVKENNNDRYELNKELKKFIKDNKEYNYIQNQDYFNFNDSNSYNIYNEQSENNNFDNRDTQGDKENVSENEEKNIISEENDINNSINELNKKDEIPLLIIEVNIKQGIKKKIYVYEGDTPKLLSEKFARENNLDLDIQNKLQNLIHHHMFKLLTRIDEENLSYSEKSQNAKNKIIN